MNKKQKRIMQSNYSLRTGVKLFRKATGRSLDISVLVKSDFSKKSLSKHNWGIYSDPEFRETDAVTNEVTSMLLSMPGDPFYPEINPENKEWLAMLGIKPPKSRSGYAGELLLYYKYLSRVILNVVRVVKRSIRQAKQSGSFTGTPIHDMVNYLFSRSIATRHGHDKGRHRNPEKHGEDDNFQAKFVSREIKENNKQHDSAIPADTDCIESKIMLQQTLEMYHRFTTKEQLSVTTMMLSINQGISWNRAFASNESKFRSLGITTPKGAKKCYDKLDEKYPEWRHIRDSRKQ